VYFEEFELGQQFTVENVPIDEEKIVSFAQIYDPLPIHLDETFAQTMTVKRTIAPGVMSFMLVWAEFVRLDIWRDTMIAGRFTKIEWFAPVFAGDVLRGDAVVTKLIPRRDKGEVEIIFRIYNQEGVQVIHDTTNLYAKRRPR
jgi:acyl dehydratase